MIFAGFTVSWAVGQRQRERAWRLPHLLEAALKGTGLQTYLCPVELSVERHKRTYVIKGRLSGERVRNAGWQTQFV